MADRVRFRQTDVVRAIKAAHSAGMAVQRVRILPDGGIELDLGKEGNGEHQAPGTLDQWLINDEAFGPGPQ
ncbi:MAG: hypothetical protein ACLFV8_14910 [Alphaproteobacteria bacterium]